MARKPRDVRLEENAVAAKKETTQHITAIVLDDTLTARTPHLSHERQVAVNDLIEWNHFAVKGADGPYTLTLKGAENRLTMSVTSPSLTEPASINMPLAPFRGLMRDYFLICESYFEAVKTGNLPRIEAIDMSRRGLHNEGSELISELLKDKVEIDSETARRLFTLLSVLHLK
jgi:uncharacterized protein (UPF0262 family)